MPPNRLPGILPAVTQHYGAIRSFSWILRIGGLALIVFAFVLAVQIKTAPEGDRMTAITTFIGLLAGGVVMMYWGELGVAIADGADHARHTVELLEGRLPALLRQITGKSRKEIPDLTDEPTHRGRRG